MSQNVLEDTFDFIMFIHFYNVFMHENHKFLYLAQIIEHIKKGGKVALIPLEK